MIEEYLYKVLNEVKESSKYSVPTVIGEKEKHVGKYIMDNKLVLGFDLNTDEWNPVEGLERKPLNESNVISFPIIFKLSEKGLEELESLKKIYGKI